jgi:SARP family transcriptional regulator, regulator of embCAB operon
MRARGGAVQTGAVTTPDGGAAPLRLLIADDLARTRRALRALLAAHPGFEVVGEAADGEDAVAAVERLRPDLVVLDVWMPRLDGIAAAARIKHRWPHVRVVAHSLAVELRADALAAGADAFVPKGAPTEELLGALRAAGGTR